MERSDRFSLCGERWECGSNIARVGLALTKDVNDFWF